MKEMLIHLNYDLNYLYHYFSDILKNNLMIISSKFDGGNIILD